jgi:hypothetical protein
MRRTVACVVSLILLASGSSALARDVYLNGVKLDSSVIVQSQTFPACEVVFDAQGDVHITAKGFKIDVKPSASETPAAPISARYWLVSKQAKKGLAQYDVDVFINGRLIKKVRAQDDPVILEVTRYVKPGSNAVKLVAVKSMGDKRLSSSPTDTLEIVLGEGTVGGGTVSITRSLVSYVRSAHETKNFSDETRFDAR